MFQIVPGSEFTEWRNRYTAEISKWDALINKTADLFLRLNTDQAEMVATVLYTVHELRNQKDASEEDALNAVTEWKRRMAPSQVAGTIRNLGVLRWHSLKPSEKLTEQIA